MMSATLEMGAAIIISASCFALNWKVRQAMGYAMSAATDFALAIIAFDLAMLAANKVFAQIVPDPFYKSNFVLLIVILLCITIIVWSIILLPIENKVAGQFNYVVSSYEHNTAIPWLLLSWTITLMIFSMHIIIFIWGSVV